MHGPFNPRNSSGLEKEWFHFVIVFSVEYIILEENYSKTKGHPVLSTKV